MSFKEQSPAFSPVLKGFDSPIKVSELTEEALIPVAAIVAADEIRCHHCRAKLDSSGSGPGRKARFCSAACREAARLRRQRGLPESTPRVRPGGRRRLSQRLQTEEAEQ